MRKFEKFFKQVASIRSVLRGGNVFVVKAVIGASLDNNRTLTVNQTIQYLRITRKIKLAKQLETVAKIMRGHIYNRRINRTDAIDLNELVSAYRDVVMSGQYKTFMRRRVSYYLSKLEQ